MFHFDERRRFQIVMRNNCERINVSEIKYKKKTVQKDEALTYSLFVV